MGDLGYAPCGPLVPPSGPRDARIAIIGARPGEDEVNSRLPFTGSSGNMLWRLLRVPRDEVYVTNVRKDYSRSDSVPTKAEILAALPSLRDELSSVQANVFVALGAQALYALSSLESLEAWRGSVLEPELLPGRKMLASWHPAACLRNYPWTYVLERDLRRATRESAYPDIRRPTRTFTLNPDLDTCLGYLNSLGPIVSIDIETFGDDPVCIALADRPDRALCIPFIASSLSQSERLKVWRVLDSILRTRRIVGQNISFDVLRLERLGFRIPQIEFDTMLAHHLLWTDLGTTTKRTRKEQFDPDELAGSHDLGFLVSIYTNEPYYKHEGGFHGDWQRFWTYNCKDAACTFEVYEGLLKELTAFSQLEYFTRNTMGLIRPVMAMQTRGIRVDLEALNKVRNRMELETRYLQLQLNQKVGFSCNVKGSKDLEYLLHEKLNLPTIKRTPKTGKPATDEDTLRNLAYNSPYGEIFQLILDVRERRTLQSSFLNLHTEEGRYHAAYLIHGTATGRLSSRAIRKGYGPQLQNIPPSTRIIFVASDGKIFIQGDYRRAEAMYVAYVAGEHGLIEIFADDTRDLYKEVAAKALGISIHEVQKWQREVFKRVVHAANYGMGPKKLITVLRLAGINIEDLDLPIHGPEKRAAFLLEGYHQPFPAIRRWQSKVKEQIRATRTITNAFGRRKVYLDRLDDSTIRKALSYDPQSSVVELTNSAIRALHAQDEAIVLQVHDSVVTEVPEADLEAGIGRLKAAMLQTIILKNGLSLTIPVDVKVGKSWGSLEAPSGNHTEQGGILP